MSSSAAQTVLVIAAHPDDEVLGVGGTMARLAAEGCRVCVLIVAEGVGLRHPGFNLDDIRGVVRSANRVLGVDEVRFGGLNTGGELLDELPSRSIVGLIASHLDEIRPCIVFTHNAHDIHADHRALALASQYCFRAGACLSLRKMLAYEVLSSTEATSASSPFQPSVYYNVEPYLSRKVEALNCYASEVQPYPHPRSPEAIEVMARYRGLAAGLRSAEAFNLIREVV
jgi:N-acetylglucosamine malate deacetylase 1